jgi:LCP family protein required for cell wall assembly
MGYGSRRDDPADWDRGMDQTAQVRGDDAWDQVAPMRGQRQAGSGDRSSSASSRRAARPQGTRRGQTSGRGQAGGRGPGRGRGAKIRRSRWARFRAKSWLAQIGYVFVVLSAAFIVAVGITGYAIYQHLDANITGVKVGGLTGRTVYGELNILVLGSQERAGQHGFFGYEADPETSNSDNLLLIHLDATHTHATVLSIPRDLYTYEPGCKARPQTGTGIWGPYAYPPGVLIDGALNIGGPTCAVETVKDLTGIQLDHVIMFDFNSFRTMVDALGGVEVCAPPGGYHDGYSHLNIPGGISKVSYNEALAYVRTRHAIGTGTEEGTDVARIQLQQAFISSVAQQVEHENLFANIPSLLRIADIATKALTVDQSLGTVSALLSLARSLVHLKSANINLVTVPTTADTFDYPNPTYLDHLMAVQPQDDVLYQMVRTGQTWHGHLPVQRYSRVKVYVENGTGQEGLAGRTRTALQALGFDVTGIGDASYTPTTTVDYAGLTQADGAYTLMTTLKKFPAGNNTLAEPAGQVGTAGVVTLILGADFDGVNTSLAPELGPAPKASKTGKKGKKTAPAGGGSGGAGSGGAGSGSAGSGSGGSVAAGQSSATTGPGAVESRNAAANICSGLPAAYTPGSQGPP